MSADGRREVLKRFRDKYADADRLAKGRIIDQLVFLTGYDRKHAITLINQAPLDRPARRPGRPRSYDAAVEEALIFLWQSMGWICSKRMVPNLEEFVVTLERHGQLSLPPSIREQVLSMSASTVDRVLAHERRRDPCGRSSTRRGSLLRKQIAVRTTWEWDKTVPGYFEGDLVSHCGGNPAGSHLYTLSLTDIATGWYEPIALLDKSAEAVRAGIVLARGRLPFSMLGLDTDNGSEFINTVLHEYCKAEGIAFSRARACHKNDQAHVEQKNGSIVRRLVGYNRFAGPEACNALATVYAGLRTWQNYFQPSMKLIQCDRAGSKVSKSYDVAKTPLKRLLSSEAITDEVKDVLRAEYEALNPVPLHRRLHSQAERFVTRAGAYWPDPAIGSELTDLAEHFRLGGPPQNHGKPPACVPEPQRRRMYRKSRKPLRWQLRAGPFACLWPEIVGRLLSDPFVSVTDLFTELQQRHPGTLEDAHVSQLFRRVAEWRSRQHFRDLRPGCHVDIQPSVRPRRGSCFADHWDEVVTYLENEPFLSAHKIIRRLSKRHPETVSSKNERTLQRQLDAWRERVRKAGAWTALSTCAAAEFPGGQNQTGRPPGSGLPDSHSPCQESS